jgi:CspA family cold shock protein
MAPEPNHDPDRIIDADGAVKWFDRRKGFGFIVGPEGQDIFVHYTRIEGDGFRALDEGERVVYDAERRDRGWHASRVRRDGADTAPPVQTRRVQPRSGADRPDRPAQAIRRDADANA